MDKHRDDAREVLTKARNMQPPPDPNHVAALVKTRQGLQHAHEYYLAAEAQDKRLREVRTLELGEQKDRRESLALQMPEAKKLDAEYNDAEMSLTDPSKGVTAKGRELAEKADKDVEDQARKDGLIKPGKVWGENTTPEAKAQIEQKKKDYLHALRAKESTPSQERITHDLQVNSHGLDPGKVAELHAKHPDMSEDQIIQGLLKLKHDQGPDPLALPPYSPAVPRR
jgi:hypothetical protein